MNERQVRLIQGDSTYITGIKLNEGTGLFGGVLMYSITDKVAAGHWTSTGTDTNATSTYNYNVAGTNTAFTYTSLDGKFICSTTTGTTAQKELCENLTH